MVSIGLGALAAALMMLQLNLIGSEYVPTEDDSQFTMSLTLPPGTSLQATDAVTRRLEQLLGTIPEIDSLFTTVGSGGGFGGGSNSTRNAQIAVQLVDKSKRTRSVQQVLASARALARQIPQGYQITYAGQVQQQEQAFSTLLQALSLSVILVYMLMVALYESLLTPLAIMFSLPVALVGAFLGLYVTGNTFNIFSLIGTIMLMGLVGKNAILLVDFTDLLRRQGMSRTDAILQAGYTRLRPIVMTSSTVLFAMLPLALKLQDGGESRAPLAVVIMGGVTSSTLLTLVLVPAVYTILDDCKVLLGRMAQGLPRLAVRSRRQTRPGWVLAPGVAAPLNGNGHGGERSNGHLIDGIVHQPVLLMGRNGVRHEHTSDVEGNGRVGDPGADLPDWKASPPPSYLPSPSGRRQIRIVAQSGTVPTS